VSSQENGSWSAVGLIYLATVLSMGFVGVIIPLIAYLQHDVGATSEQMGFAIALFSAPSAVLAGIGGAIVDRVGARASLIVSGVFAVIADPLIAAASSVATLDIATLVAGVGFAGITVSAPALIMAITRGARRPQAMSVWSTYPPAGLSLGLLFAVPFAGPDHWRWALVLHGAVMIIITAGIFAVQKSPRPAPSTRGGRANGGPAEFVAAFGNLGVVRLAAAACLPAGLAYGTTLVIPSYLANAQNLSLSTASTIVAFANLATILGGLVAGYVLARQVSALALYGVTVLAGILGQLLLFLPGAGLPVAMTGLMIWTFTIGGSIAATMALLPRVVRDPARGAAASGVVGQFISAASFLVPSLYFGILGKGGSMEFVLLAAAALVLSLFLLPTWKVRASGDARPGMAPPV